MALIDKLSAIGNAIREKNGTTELIPLVDMPQAILDIVSGGGVEYSNITYNDDNTITLIETNGTEHTMACVYEDDKLVSVSYDNKEVSVNYKDDKMYIGDTVVDLSNVEDSGALLDYTVTFTVDGEPYEIVSVKNGNMVNAPATEPTSEGEIFTGWHLNDTKFDFTNPVENDVELVAKFGTIADTVYAHYGVSREEYPRLEIAYYANGKRVAIYFAKSVSCDFDKVYYSEHLYAISYDANFTNYANIEKALEHAFSQIVVGSLEKRASGSMVQENGYAHYVNFELSGLRGSVYKI
jgi:hypothetical protein